MPQPTIKHARIEHPPKDKIEAMTQGFFQARVFADFTDGQEDVKILEYYDDELTFHPYEFIGKTMNEVHQLFTEKDIRYLRS